MYEFAICVIIYISLKNNKVNQAEAFALLLLSYFAITPFYGYANEWFPLKDVGGNWIKENFENHYTMTNILRVLQHLFLSITIFFTVYKDRRAFIPTLINTVIIVLYLSSCLFIFQLDSLDIQRFISINRVGLGLLVLLSLIDYGDRAYDRIYSTRVFTSGGYLSRLYSVFAFRTLLEEKKESEVI